MTDNTKPQAPQGLSSCEPTGTKLTRADVIAAQGAYGEARNGTRRLPPHYAGHCLTVGCHNVATYHDDDDSYRCSTHTAQLAPAD